MLGVQVAAGGVVVSSTLSSPILCIWRTSGCHLWLVVKQTFNCSKLCDLN